MQIFVRLQSGTNVPVEIDPSWNSDILLQALASQNIHIPSTHKLMFGPNELNSAYTLSQYGIQEGSCITLLRKSAYAHSTNYSQPTQQTTALPNAIPVQQPRVQLLSPWENEQFLKPNEPSTPYFRFSSTCFPKPFVASTTPFPLGIVVTPALVSECPVADYTNKSEIPCCKKCKTYLNPYVEYTSDYAGWVCPACQERNAFGEFGDIFGSCVERTSPVVDIHTKAFTTYEPGYCFIIDISIPSVSTGFTSQFIYSIKATLGSMPDNVNIMLMTTGDTLSIFNFETDQEIIIGDLSESQIVPRSVLTKLGPVRQKVELALDHILSQSGETTSTGHCIGDAYEYATQAMQITGGCIIAGFTGFPTCGTYPLTDRQSNPEITEQNLFKLPQLKAAAKFRDITYQMNKHGVSLYAFTTGPGFCDLSVTGVAAGLTGGMTHHYPVFDSDARVRMHSDLFTAVTKKKLWGAELHIRTSPWIQADRFYSNCLLPKREGTAKFASFSVLQYDDCCVVQFGRVKMEQKVERTERTFVQAQLIYTTDECERRIRVFSFVVPNTDNMADVAAGADECAIISLLTRRGLSEVLTHGTKYAQGEMMKHTRQMIASGVNLRSIPFLAHSLLENAVMRSDLKGGVDVRLAQIITMRSINMTDLTLMLYPRFFAVHEDATLTMHPLVSSSFIAASCFLVQWDDRIVIWVNTATPEFLSDLFGVVSMEEIPSELPPSGGAVWAAVTQKVNECMQLSGKYLPVIIVPRGDPRETIFSDFLVDELKTSGYDLNGFVNSLNM